MRKEVVLLAALSAILAWCAAPAGAEPNVLAKWALDEGAGQVAADASGHANTGVLGAAADPDAADPGWVPGHAGSALSFNGSSYVSIPDTGGLKPAHVAVDAWVQHAGSPGRWRYVLSNGSLECNRSAYGLYSGQSGGMAFYVSSTSEYTVSPEVAAGLVWDGAWHHVIGSYDGVRVRLWIDGSQVGTGTATSAAISYASGSRGVYIGTYRGSCELGFSGAIDDATVWDDRPAEATTGPVIEPVASTATHIPLEAADSSAAPTTTAPQPKGCARVTLSRHTIPIRRKTKLVATVRRGSRRVAGARLVVTGKGVTTTGRRTTDLKGKTKLAVRARKAGRLQVTVRGQKTGCSATTIRAR